MKIGIDARFLGPVSKGLGRYVERLVENLEKVDPIRSFSKSENSAGQETQGDEKGGAEKNTSTSYGANEYVIFLRRENWDYYTPKFYNFKKVLADYPWYSFKEQIMMPLAIWKEKVDLMHFPHFNIPILCPVKFVVTIHDLILLQFPTPRATTLGQFLYRIKYLAYKFVIWFAVWRARKILTVSEYTKKEIIKYFKIKEEKIEVAYEACDGVEYGQLKMPEKESLIKLGITKPFILYVGNAYPHKNLETLIEVYRNLDFDCQLVFVGKEDYFYKRLKEMVHKGERNKIIFTDFVKEAVLADLYRGARLYVFSSFVEGFGLPGLEAMNYGLPVVASNSSCLEEIYEDAAVYFDPRDKDDIIEKIKRVYLDEDLRGRLREKGFLQIKKYSWEFLAKKTFEVYKKACHEEKKRPY